MPANDKERSRSREAMRREAARTPLAYWRALLSEYPTSNHIPEATYRAGMICLSLEDFDLGEGLLSAFTHEYRDTPFACDALLALVQHYLSRRLSPNKAQEMGQSLFELLNSENLNLSFERRRDQNNYLSDKDTSDSQENPFVLYGDGTQDVLPIVVPGGYYTKEDIQGYCLGVLFFLTMQSGNHVETKRLITLASETTGIHPHYRRMMKAWEKHANATHFMATPEEAKGFSEKESFLLALGDFFYASRDFSSAEHVYDSLLSGTYGKLSDTERDYAFFAKAKCYYQSAWTTDKDAVSKTISLFEKCLSEIEGNPTEPRAAMAIISYARGTASTQLRKRRHELINWLQSEFPKSGYAAFATIHSSLDAYGDGHITEAIQMLDAIPSSNPLHNSAQSLKQYWTRKQ